MFRKFILVQFSVLIKHPHAATDGKVAVADNIGSLHAKDHNHYGGPFSNPFKGCQLLYYFGVGQLTKRPEIKLSISDLFGKFSDVFGFFESHPQPLQGVQLEGTDWLGADGVWLFAEPLPDGILGMNRDLLSDDVADNGGEKIAFGGSLDMSDAVDGGTELPVPVF